MAEKALLFEVSLKESKERCGPAGRNSLGEHTRPLNLRVTFHIKVLVIAVS